MKYADYQKQEKRNNDSNAVCMTLNRALVTALRCLALHRLSLRGAEVPACCSSCQTKYCPYNHIEEINLHTTTAKSVAMHWCHQALPGDSSSSWHSNCALALDSPRRCAHCHELLCRRRVQSNCGVKGSLRGLKVERNCHALHDFWCIGTDHMNSYHLWNMPAPITQESKRHTVNPPPKKIHYHPIP